MKREKKRFKIRNPEDFAAFAQPIENITVPENTKIVALGEATHGNVEFQQLKLSVFQNLVENDGMRVFALEGDFGGCEQVNRYIHGGEGTVEEAAAAIGFALYRTKEMEELETLLDGEKWSSEYDTEGRKRILKGIRTELSQKEGAELAIHYTDVLLQNCELGEANSADMRDKYMAENILWIYKQEQRQGNDCVFVSGHNSHIGKFGYDNMGKLLADAMGSSYYCIGTDLYKTNCNLPVGSSGRRTNQVFYSHDPLANAAKKAGMDICWLDFSRVSQSKELSTWISDYHCMGSVREGYGIWMRLLPQSYRIFQQPNALYNGMIFVTEATPTEIKNNR